MKVQGRFCSFPLFLAALCLFIPFSGAAQTKQIRLRNEIILTTRETNAPTRAQVLSLQAPATGLYLLQFGGDLLPLQREQLKAMGVELLKYVPEDAFVARFKQVGLEQIKALSFVHYVTA